MTITLLIITTGRTDVQLVNDKQRCELNGKTCGLLHTELQQRGYKILDSPPRKEKSSTASLPEGDLSVCTPKLDAVMNYRNSSPPTGAIIFETRRVSDPGDPHLAGEILEKRLKTFGINVRRHSYLPGEVDGQSFDRYDDQHVPENAVVRRSIVTGFSNVISEEISKQQPAEIILATTGGPTPINEITNELVRLHSVGVAKVIPLESPEDLSVSLEGTFHPATGFRARWHALELIENGNLLGAWGAVSHLKDAPGQDWTRVVWWLAQFASSQPFEPPLPTDSDLTVLKHERMAVRAALRVELALRAGDIPRAVHGTVAFFEAALGDGLYERLERSPEREKRRYFRVVKGDAPSGNKLLRVKDAKDNPSRPFQLKETDPDGINWYWFYEGEGGPSERIANHFLARAALTTFSKVLTQKNEFGETFYTLRNDVAHNEPTPELMNEARQRMREAQLWSADDTFLSQPLVQNVLKELGEPHPEQLCTGLMAAVRKHLLAIS